MSETVLAALIGGVCSLLAVWYSNYLAERKEHKKAQLDKAPSSISPKANKNARAYTLVAAATKSPTANASTRAGVQETPAEDTIQQVTKPRSRSPFWQIFKGILILLVDFIIFGVMVSAFDLNHTHPWWDVWFSVIAIGAIPVYAIYLIIAGFFKTLRQLFIRK